MTIIDLHVNSGKLRFDPVDGRRTWYVSLTLFNHTWWFQWWDTERCSRHQIFWRSRDGLMCATMGSRGKPKASGLPKDIRITVV